MIITHVSKLDGIFQVDNGTSWTGLRAKWSVGDEVQIQEEHDDGRDVLSNVTKDETTLGSKIGFYARTILRGKIDSITEGVHSCYDVKIRKMQVDPDSKWTKNPYVVFRVRTQGDLDLNKGDQVSIARQLATKALVLVAGHHEFTRPQVISK